MSSAAENFDVLAIDSSVLHNYFDSSTKLLFWSTANILSFSKIILSIFR